MPVFKETLIIWEQLVLTIAEAKYYHAPSTFSALYIYIYIYIRRQTQRNSEKVQFRCILVSDYVYISINMPV